MKKFGILLAVFVNTLNFCIGQESNIKKNSISFNILGTSSYAGISYERLFFQRMKLELGIGIVGVGVGINYYPLSKLRENKLNAYTGVRTILVVFLSERLISYIPIGITYMGKNNLSLNVDIGPAYQTIYSPWGKVTQEVFLTYPKSKISAYGNLKLSYNF